MGARARALAAPDVASSQSPGGRTSARYTACSPSADRASPPSPLRRPLLFATALSFERDTPTAVLTGRSLRAHHPLTYALTQGRYELTVSATTERRERERETERVSLSLSHTGFPASGCTPRRSLPLSRELSRCEPRPRSSRDSTLDSRRGNSALELSPHPYPLKLCLASRQTYTDRNSSSSLRLADFERVPNLQVLKLCFLFLLAKAKSAAFGKSLKSVPRSDCADFSVCVNH